MTEEKYIRDEHSNAIINNDDIEYQIFIKERAKLRDIRMLSDKINELEKRLKILEESKN